MLNLKQNSQSSSWIFKIFKVLAVVFVLIFTTFMIVAKTNPYFSTSGLNTLIGQSYAASGKQADLTADDVAASEQFSKDVESCVIHYGTTTGKVLQRLYDRDQQGDSLGYVSAVAVEETSVINYNLGNPQSKVIDENGTVEGSFDGPRQKITPPAHKLVAIYPTEGSLVSNNPLVVLGPKASWVTPEQRTAGEAFQRFVVTEEAQQLLGDYGFRPVTAGVAPGGLVTLANGVDPDQPKVVLPNPPAAVTSAAQILWDKIRKPSSVLMVLDVSKSMKTVDAFDADGNPTSRINAARTAAQANIGHFRPTDQLGVWAFTTDLPENEDKTDPFDSTITEIYPLQAGAREGLFTELGAVEAGEGGTPLYDTVLTAYNYMKDRAEAGRINAIILLSDGEDRDSTIRDINQLLPLLQPKAEEEDLAPVRIFPIAFSKQEPAAAAALTAIAEATGGQVFDASSTRRLQAIFQQVVNNF